MPEETISSPKVSFCCSALEFFQDEVLITGYTVEMVMLIKGAHKEVIHPNVDTWEMEKALKEIQKDVMDKLLVPKNMKQVTIEKKDGSVSIYADRISITLPESKIVLLDCKNFMMDEVAIIFLKKISEKFPNSKIGMKISFGEPVGEAEVWL